nr:hypothetical protein [Escherichia coli]
MAALSSTQKDRDQLAAECAALKHAMSVTMEHVSVMDTGQAGVAAMIINDALHNSETPATDRFLAEQKYSALKSYAESISLRMKDKKLSMREKDRLNFAWAEVNAHMAEIHNAQLRNEVKV